MNLRGIVSPGVTLAYAWTYLADGSACWRHARWFTGWSHPDSFFANGRIAIVLDEER